MKFRNVIYCCDIDSFYEDNSVQYEFTLINLTFKRSTGSNSAGFIGGRCHGLKSCDWMPDVFAKSYHFCENFPNGFFFVGDDEESWGAICTSSTMGRLMKIQ